MPKRNERNTIDAYQAKAKAARSNIRAIGERRIEIRGRHGDVAHVTLNPSDFNCSRLAAQLADQWTRQCAGFSVSVVRVHLQTMKKILTFVDNFTTDSADVALDRHPEVMASALLAWSSQIQL